MVSRFKGYLFQNYQIIYSSKAAGAATDNLKINCWILNWWESINDVFLVFHFNLSKMAYV